MKEKGREAHLLPTTVVCTPERVNLGVLGAMLWQRPEEVVAHERTCKPIEEKESCR